MATDSKETVTITLDGACALARRVGKALLYRPDGSLDLIKMPPLGPPLEAWPGEVTL